MVVLVTKYLLVELFGILDSGDLLRHETRSAGLKAKILSQILGSDCSGKPLLLSVRNCNCYLLQTLCYLCVTQDSFTTGQQLQFHEVCQLDSCTRFNSLFFYNGDTRLGILNLKYCG